MKNEIEKEYKILLSADQFHKLCTFYNDLRFIRQTNTYFDTADNMIQKMHGAMRLREKENITIFTLKMHSELGLMEHEDVVPINNVSAFSLAEVKDILNLYQIHGPFFETAVCITDRAVVKTPFAELCFDKNQFHNGAIDYEIEYEYIKEHDGFQEFNKILQQIHMSYTHNCLSKIKRALDSQV